MGKKHSKDARKDFKTVFMESKRSKSNSMGVTQTTLMRRNIQM